MCSEPASDGRPSRGGVARLAHWLTGSNWVVVLLYALATAALTWPQIVRPLSVPDHVDPYFSLWRLAWVAHQLRADPVHLFDGNIFYPARATLAYSDAMLFEGVAAAPLLWAGVPVVLVYNVEVLLTFVASGFGAFLLVRHLTGSRPAAIVAGLIFAFVPYRFDHYLHLELLHMEWMPLACWMFVRTLESGRLSDGIWAGVFGALVGLSCVYYGVLFALAMAPVAVALLVEVRRGRRTWIALGVAIVVSAVPLLLYAQPYRRSMAQVGRRTAGDLALYSAGPTHYLASMPDNFVYGRLTGDLGRHEKRLFPGLLAASFVVLALWPPFERRRLVWALGLIAAVDVSFGYRGIVTGPLLETIPPLQGLRAYARSGAVVMLFTAVLAGHGFARLTSRLGHWRPATRTGLLAVVGTLEQTPALRHRGTFDDGPFKVQVYGLDTSGSGS